MFDWRMVSRREANRHNLVGAVLAGTVLCSGGIAAGALLTTKTVVNSEPTHWGHPVPIARTPHDQETPTRADAGGFATLAENVKPAVTAVTARSLDDDPRSNAVDGGLPHPPYGAPDRPRFATSLGSGFFITADGYIVTNDHVLGGSSVAEVKLDDGRVYKARVVGSDRASDIALLKIDGRSGFAHVQLAEALPNVGDRVITVGNPFGLGGTVTAGIVSALGRDVSQSAYQNLIQIDAPVNKGNSGGPIFDVAGNVIGVNSIIFSPTGGSVGIALAIPADKVRSVVRQLKEKGSVTRGWLGVQYQSVSPGIADTLGIAASGILVADVSTNGPARDAGLAPGDLIMTVSGAPIRHAHAFSRILDDTPPGAALLLGIVHRDEVQSVIANVASAPRKPGVQRMAETSHNATHESAKPQLGLRLAPPGAANSNGRGAMVVGIDPTGLAAGRGIDLGDVILDVASKQVDVPDDVFRLVADAQLAGKRAVLVRIKSGEKAQFVTLPLEM